MKSKKTFIILIIILLVAVISIICISLKKENKFKIEKVETPKREYFLSFDEKYGIIDKQGNSIIQEKYDMIQIPNPSKDVFICFSNYNSEKGSYETKVLDKDRHEIFPELELVEAIVREENLDDIPYEKSVLKYKKNGKYGIIDFLGNKITKPIYEEIKALEYKEGFLIVKKDGKQGVINIYGDELIKPEYDDIESDLFYTEGYNYEKSGFITSIKTKDGYKYGYINYDGKNVLKTEYNEIARVNYYKNFDDIYIVAFKDGKAGLIKNGKIILKHEYEDIQFDSSNSIFIVQKLGKQGVYNIEGKEILKIIYDNIIISGSSINAQNGDNVEVYDISGKYLENQNYIGILSTNSENYYVTIDKNDNYGIIDKSGNVIFENRYTFIDYLSNDYFVAQKDEFFGIIDSSGKEIIKFKYEILQKIEGTNMLEGFIGDTVELINKKMEFVISLDNARIEEKNNYIIIYNQNKRKYFDFDGNELKNIDVLNNSKLFAKEENGKWGFIDVDGNSKIKCQYEMVTEQNERGFAGIKQNGKWGVINSNGEIIKEPTYEIDDINPDFIGEYYKVNLGYGEEFYTKNIE